MNLSIKKMLAFVVLATASFSYPLSNEAVSFCYETQLEGDWKYVEFKFIYQPGKYIETLTKHIQAGMLTTSALLFLTRNKINHAITGSNEVIGFDAPTAIASGILCMAGYYTYYCNLVRNVKRETLEDFLSNWNYHRDFMPEALIPAFDELAFDFQAASAIGVTFTDAQVTEVFDIIQHLLEHIFDKRYAVSKKPFDALDSFKKLTEISKNIVPSKGA